MATTAQGIGDYSAGFEKVIQPYIQDNVPVQTRLLKVVKTNDNVEIFNNNFYVSLRTGRHGGVQTLANDKSKLNTGGAPIGQGTIGPTYQAGVFDISDVVIKASRSRRQAMESDLQFQAQALVADFSKQLNRQYFSDGAGVVAEVSGSVGVGTIQISYPDGSLGGAVGAAPYYGTAGINGDIQPWAKYFAPGNIIGMGTTGISVGTIGGSAQAVSGGTQYGTLIITGTQGTGAVGSAPVYILDGDADAAGTTEILGFRGMLSEGTNTYMGLSRSTLTWQPQIMGTSQNQSLSIPNMEQLYWAAYEFAKPGDRYAWFMNRSLISKFGDLLTALRRTVNRVELVSGWGGLSFQAGMDEVAVIPDYDCPDGEAHLVNLETLTVCEIAPMGFVQDELLRRADYITFQKVFSWYTNLANRAPAASGRMVRQTR
jgi:hypothetical protein